MLYACIQKFDVAGTVENSMLHACASIAALCASTVDPIKKAWQRKAVGSACTSMNDRPEFTEGNKSKVTDSSTVFLLQGRLLIPVLFGLEGSRRAAEIRKCQLPEASGD